MSLHDFLRFGYPAIEELIENNADINLQNSSGGTPLFEACGWNRYDIAEILLKANADVNICNNINIPPLGEAAFRGNDKLCNLLIQYKADPNGWLTKDNNDNIMLIVSIIKFPRNINVIKILVENGADVNATAPSFGGSPLEAAIIANDPDIVNILIENMADLNTTFRDGNTPIIYAIKTNKICIEIIELLINNGADTEFINKEGKKYSDYIKCDILKKEIEKIIGKKYKKAKGSL